MKDRFDTSLVKWLVEEGIAFHVVRSAAFTEMLTTLSGCSDYVPPRERRLTGLARKKAKDQNLRVKDWIRKGCQTASISVDGMYSSLFFSLSMFSQIQRLDLPCG